MSVPAADRALGWVTLARLAAARFAAWADRHERGINQASTAWGVFVLAVTLAAVVVSEAARADTLSLVGAATCGAVSATALVWAPPLKRWLEERKVRRVRD